MSSSGNTDQGGVKVYLVENLCANPTVEELRLYLERLRETKPMVYRHIAAFIKSMST